MGFKWVTLYDGHSGMLNDSLGMPLESVWLGDREYMIAQSAKDNGGPVQRALRVVRIDYGRERALVTDVADIKVIGKINKRYFSDKLKPWTVEELAYSSAQKL